MMSFIETYTKSITISSVRFYNKRRVLKGEKINRGALKREERELYYCGRYEWV